MQNDILPPYLKRSNTKTAKSSPMRSMRLQGHSFKDARERLIDAEATTKKTPELTPTPKEEVPTITLNNDPGKMRWHHKIKHHLSKRSKLELTALGIFVLLFGGALFYLIFHYAHRPVEHLVFRKPVAKVEAKPKTVASPLTGAQVSPDLAARPVTGIMIENSLDARPQSGLQDAGVVYEAVAEAGITRFLALFQDTSPQYVGPVRSLRPYYIDFAAPYQAGIVHVGGSPDALAEVKNGQFRNLDQFANGSYFHRISSRAAPHNVYTSFSDLDKLNQSKGYTSSQFTGLPRKNDKKLAIPTAKTIDFKISSASYYVHYDYDAGSNGYLRSEGGAPHMELTSADDKGGSRLQPKVVVALVMSLKNGALDASGAYYSNYADTGSGTAYVFQDGGVTQGTWAKSSTTDQLHLNDSTGQPIKLNAGQTWISLVSAASQVTSAP